MIPDHGSILDGDTGRMLGLDLLLLDRSLYRFNVYHFTISSLGPKVTKYIKKVRSGNYPGFGGGNAIIRTQPRITNLLSSNDTEYEYSLLPPVPKLDWEF